MGRIILGVIVGLGIPAGGLWAQGAWEVTPESRAALDRGLQWLAANQGPDGNWESDDLGLVSLGLLAFLADGHFPGRGPYGENAERALDYILDAARADGLLNIANPHRDMYNHGLSTFVLAQAYGMADDPRLGPTLQQALRVIAQTQCDDGGWDYRAARRSEGHDLSLAVMQANALRSAVDSGFEVHPYVVRSAIRSVREHYLPIGVPYSAPESVQMLAGGQFTYRKQGRGGRTLAMAAAGVVCLQEFGQYDDWRIAKNMEVISREIHGHSPSSGAFVLDPYTLYYVAQAVYQVGDPWWQDLYPELRDMLVRSQVNAPDDPRRHGMWPEFGGRVGKLPGNMFATAVGCFVLAIPNRYLPILQEGKVEAVENLR